MEARAMTCPRAKLLAGSWMCPCHGLAKARKTVRRLVKEDPVEVMFDGMLQVLQVIREAVR